MMILSFNKPDSRTCSGGTMTFWTVDVVPAIKLSNFWGVAVTPITKGMTQSPSSLLPLINFCIIDCALFSA